jgi:hypothetical protein
MLVQFYIDQNAYKLYPCNGLHGRFKAKLQAISYHDDLGAGQHRLLRVVSPSIQCQAAQFNNSILFARGAEHSRNDFEAPEFVLDVQDQIAFEIFAVAGGAIGVTSWLVLTVDVEPLDG